MDVTFNRVDNLRDFKLHRELLFRNGDRLGYKYTKKYEFDIDEQEMIYFKDYHHFYLVRDSKNSGILGSFFILVSSPGVYLLMGLGVEESAKRKGIGTKIMNFIYKNYSNLILLSRYSTIEFYAKTYSKFKKSGNIYIATDYINIPEYNKVIPISNWYDKNREVENEVCISPFYDLLNLDKVNQEVILEAWNEMCDLISYLLPKKTDRI